MGNSYRITEEHALRAEQNEDYKQTKKADWRFPSLMELLENVYEDARFNPEYDEKTGYRTHSIIALPVKRINKQEFDDEIGRFDDEDVQARGQQGGLSHADVERYGRQIVLPSLGVGCIGIVDADTVALSNLHRQIGHSWRWIGRSKAESLAHACQEVNQAVSVKAHSLRLNERREAADLMAGYDVVVDCTDAPPSRYLLNDAALSAARPLVAASAVGLSGQLAVYNFEGGPCLRCVFPVLASPADAEPVASCEENGVLGPIVGTVGSLAALEALKVLAKQSALHKSCLRGKLLLFDPTSSLQPCRTVRIRRQPDCVGCASKDDGDPPVPLTCAVPSQLTKEISISPKALHERLSTTDPIILLDVRQPAHFAVTRLKAAVNWPLTEMNRQSLED
ncbi:Adenylyltransferase and sulfurtransferase MOCS3 (Molybdenum cofactor synthesis protein 3) (Ubiquitin activating enzyme 4) [Includes: Molybdopterin-synthase adenylyltransferase (Adenylyltransferase MOCS3) (Sulfur carrier protein MOCS2A adenylyltransferase) [Durusdinium trenchii]|uniref:Adenylyltransferase and sulfurtransferase MOCS3 (Molybdenum cofactor synthesis protein 3) (Ubiquitin activating enzyme 4) n=1 Tax=Durusdinium trenchii TaxID=1381693 RepID=A0ABP0NMU8_9DINO